MMVIGTLALTGFPLTAGYFSKDAIIEAAFVGKNPMALYAFVCTVVAALLTSFYSWRLIFKTFHGEPHDQHHYEARAREPAGDADPARLPRPSARSSPASPFKEIFAGHGVEEFFRESLKFGQGNHVLEDMHHVPLPIAFVPTVMMALGFVVAWQFYIRRPEIPVELARQHELLYRFLLNKWYFDELYDLIFVRPAMWLGRVLWKGGDGWLIDGFGPDGVSARVLDVTRNVVRLQTGYLYHYAFAMLIGAAAFITWFMFAVRWQVQLMNLSWPILSVITFLPLVGALFIMLMVRGDEAVASATRAGWRCGPRWSPSRSRWSWSGASIASSPEFQFVEKHALARRRHRYHMGVDGISLPFVILTTALMPICIIASWTADPDARARNT